ncbi:S9 family peptidase, partial [Pseudomonas sp. FW305-130]
PARGTARDLTPGAFELESFLLSSDGTGLVYAANAGDLERRHIWTVPLTGGAAMRLTHGAGSETIPTFAGTTLAVLATSATQLAHPALVGDALAPLH